MASDRCEAAAGTAQHFSKFGGGGGVGGLTSETSLSKSFFRAKIGGGRGLKPLSIPGSAVSALLTAYQGFEGWGAGRRIRRGIEMPLCKSFNSSHSRGDNKSVFLAFLDSSPFITNTQCGHQVVASVAA